MDTRDQNIESNDAIFSPSGPENKPSQTAKTLGLIFGLLAGCLVLLAALGVSAWWILPNLIPVGEIRTAETFERPQADGNAAGDPQAPIKMVEYSDFQCPYCARFTTQTEQQLMDTYVATGKVYFVYRSMGLFIGQDSVDAAQAAYCAGDQGKFWEMHDIIFANLNSENAEDFTPRRLTAFAENIGLDRKQFKSCFDRGAKADLVTQDQIDGHAAGVMATPTFIMTYTINGQTKTVVIEGAVPFSEFQDQIEQAWTEIGR